MDILNKHAKLAALLDNNVLNYAYILAHRMNELYNNYYDNARNLRLENYEVTWFYSQHL